jgi:hypothetical protein
MFCPAAVDSLTLLSNTIRTGQHSETTAIGRMSGDQFATGTGIRFPQCNHNSHISSVAHATFCSVDQDLLKQG